MACGKKIFSKIITIIDMLKAGFRPAFLSLT
nr:MAG TPA: hypothetical protein [Caudoviricetes sp.]